jgi:uncharacterized membrane protein YkoI
MTTVPMLFWAASTLALPPAAGSSSADSARTPAAARAPAGTEDEERDEQEQEEEAAAVSLAKLPPAVREAIRRVAGPNAIKEVEKETRAGVTTYEAEYRANGVEHSVTVSATGEVLEVEKEVAPARLPAEVRAALEKRFPGGVIREAEAVYVGEAASPTYYEVEVKDGLHTRELKLRPSGEIMEGSP